MKRERRQQQRQQQGGSQQLRQRTKPQELRSVALPAVAVSPSACMTACASSSERSKGSQQKQKRRCESGSRQAARLALHCSACFGLAVCCSHLMFLRAVSDLTASGADLTARLSASVDCTHALRSRHSSLQLLMKERGEEWRRAAQLSAWLRFVWLAAIVAERVCALFVAALAIECVYVAGLSR